MIWIMIHSLGFLFSLSTSLADQEEKGSLFQRERLAEKESWTGLERGWYSQPFALRPTASPGSLGRIYVSVHRRCAQLGVSESSQLCNSVALAGPYTCAPHRPEARMGSVALDSYHRNTDPEYTENTI